MTDPHRPAAADSRALDRDPLIHPRLTLLGRAAPVDKARVYYDVADFGGLILRAEQAMRNAGFGRAHRLAPDDLGGLA